MFPLSSVPPTFAAQAIRPQADLASRELRLPDMPGVQETAPFGPLPGAGNVQPAGESFSTMLGKMVEEVSVRQAAAADALSALQSGQSVSLHQAVIAMEEANVSFQLMVEVRNKLLESYQELMRMQI